MTAPLVFIVAGEPSGDLLAGRMMAAMKAINPDIRFAGVGGDTMAAQGLDSLFPMSDLTVMGIAEVLPHLPLLLRRIRETAQAVRRLEPDIIVTVDAPDFSFRVVKKLSGLTTPKVHYVAPTVWAWRAGRAKKIARLYDQLLCLLPFEPPYFERVGLDASFVGHSAVEARPSADAAAFRRSHNIAPDAPLLCVLPGSRSGEVNRLLPTFHETVDGLKARHPDLRIVVPTVGKVQQTVSEALKSWPGAPVIVSGTKEKEGAFAAATAALAASGTVSLELAIAGVPHVVAYKLAPLTYAIAKRLVKVPHVSLINLVAEERLVPEFIQEACTASQLLEPVSALLSGHVEAERQRAGFAANVGQLGASGALPSQRAAEVVLAQIAPGTADG